MAKRVGLISINLVAGTAQFNADMGKAKAQIVAVGGAAQDAGKHVVSGMQASSAAIRVMEGGMTNNLRAVERFVSGTLGLGPALQAIFPVVGALAFGGLIVSIGEKVYTFFKNAQEGATRVANAFRELNQPLRLTNDELRLANDHLANDIAKLEGKRQNNLAVALDEARVVADKLAKSLDDDLQKLEKLMKENNIGKLNGLFTGRAGTGKDEDEVKRFTDEMARTDSEGLRSVRDAKGKDAIDAAMKAWQAKSLAAIDSEIGYFRELVKESERLQGGQVIHTRDAQGNPVDVRTAQRGPDQTGAIIERRGVVDTLNELRDNAQLQMDNYALSVRKGNDEATNANAKLDRPLDDKLAEVGEQLKESQDRLDVSGKSEEMKEMASADIAAGKAIMEVNKALERLHEKPMPQATEDAFHLLEAMIAQNNAQAKWNDSLAATTSKMEERTASYRDLAAAVGLSYEATKKAEAELAVKEFAKEKYGDAAWMADPRHQADISKVRADASDEFDAKHAEGVQSSLKKLDDQISLEQQLARVQADGEEAVRQTTLAAKIQAIERDNDAESAKKLIQAEKDLYAAERLNAAAKNIAEINVEIDATKRLAAAQIEGAESARRAEL